MSKGLNGFADVVVIGLGLDEDDLLIGILPCYPKSGQGGLEVDSVELGRRFPCEIFDFGIKIKYQKTGVMTGEVVF